MSFAAKGEKITQNQDKQTPHTVYKNYLHNRHASP